MRRPHLAMLLAVLAAGLALTVSACGGATATQSVSSTRPQLASEARVASDWVPISYRLAQISIPPKWYVLYEQPPCVVDGAPGELFVDPLPGVFHCPAGGPGRVPSTVVTFERLDPTITPGKRVLRIHGIVVREAAPPSLRTYLVPSLHVQIHLSGPLGRRVLGTLEPSPRRFVLGTARPPRVPAGWAWVSFAGLRALVPAAWPVTRETDYGPGCSILQSVEFFPPAGTVLDTDTHLIFLPCPYRPPGQPPNRPVNGLRIDKRWVWPAEPASSFPKRCLHIHGLRVCPAKNPAFSILVLRVSVPGRAHPSYVSLGLTGNGTVARTILYSLRAA